MYCTYDADSWKLHVFDIESRPPGCDDAMIESRPSLSCVHSTMYTEEGLVTGYTRGFLNPVLSGTSRLTSLV